MIYELEDLIEGTIDYRGKTPKRFDAGIPVISAANIKKGKIKIDDKFVTQEYYDEWTTRGFIRPGDILITTEAPVGEIAKVPNDQVYLISRRVFALQIDKVKANETFLYYYLLTQEVMSYFESISHGATVPRIYKDEVLKLKINLPPLQTQTKIANILLNYDDLIENNNKRIKLLEEMAEEIYKEWFVRFRFPGYKETKFFDKEGNEVEHGSLGALPEGWEERKAEEVFNINIGKTPPRKESEWFTKDDKDIKWVSIRDINESNVYLLDSSEKITREGASKFNMNIASKSTVILSFKLTVGRVAITTEDTLTNEAIAHFNINNFNINTSYTYWYLKLFKYGKLGNTSSIGTAINSKIVKAMPFVVPSKNIINQFGVLIDPMMEEIKTLVSKNKILQETRDLLLPRLISGKLNVEDLDINNLDYGVSKSIINTEQSIAAEPKVEYKTN